MLKIKTPQPLKNNRGFAVMESIVLLFIFLVLFVYSMGFFGVVHTSIIHTIASRNYTFEIFRHRSNLWYFRQNAANERRYHSYRNRLHGTNNEVSVDGANNLQYATERRVAMFKGEIEPVGRSSNEHAQAGAAVRPGERNTSVSLDPVWIKVQYGICLTADCGG